jgi:hypothetical protein
MNYNKTLVLALVLAALAATVFFWEIPAQKAKQAKEAEGEKISDLKYDSVHRIELQRGAEDLEFTKEKTGDEWLMTKPFPDQTERWMVQSLLSAFRFARPSRVLKDVSAADLARFGLDKPRAVITLDAAGVVKRFRVGVVNPIDKSAYVQPEDQNTVFLITESTLSAIQKPVSEFRRQDLLAVRDAKEKLSRVTIDMPGQPPLTMVLEKPAKTETEGTPEDVAPPEPAWRLDGPNGPIVDEVAMKGILDKVGALKVQEFGPKLETPKADETGGGPNPDPKYGFDKPSLGVTVVYGEGETAKTLTLTVGAAAPVGALTYAQVSGRPYVVLVQPASLKVFQVTRDDLRDRRLLGTLDAKRVAIIDLQSPNASFRISRSGNGWAFADGAPANAERADDLLRAAAKWRADELVGGPRGKRLAAQAAHPETTLSLLDADGKTLAALRFSKAVDPEEIAPTTPLKPLAKPAVEAPPAGKEQENEKQRLVVAVEGGYPDTTYLVKPKTLSDLPAGVEEMKAAAKPAADEKAAEGAAPAGSGAPFMPK